MSDDVLPAPPDSIVATRVEGGDGVLIDLDRKRYFVLNETAMLVWTAIEERRTLADAVEQMTTAFDVSPEHARSSVRRLLGELQTNQLLAVEP